MRRPPIALTMGEPAGIGGELSIAAWRALRHDGPAFVLLDDPERIAALAHALGESVPIAAVASPAEAADAFAEALPVLPLPERIPLALGRPRPATAAMVLRSIEMAVAVTMRGETAAVVTNPIHKAVLQEAGFAHPGHTEFLAELAGVERTVMMLAGPDLRVVPVTVHMPLAEVPRRLDETLIVETARIVHAALVRDFGIPAPRLAAAGLNPHAGEDGRMGREEIDVIVPALERLRAEGIDVTGPHPADTMFHPRARARYDAALCMYHDQALAPLKTIAFDDGVNVTLGLPFVRTSPDHGTAIDIAGQGIARADSLLAAIALAARLSAPRVREAA